MLRDHSGNCYTVWSRVGKRCGLTSEDIDSSVEARQANQGVPGRGDNIRNGTEARGRVWRRWPNFSLWLEPEIQKKRREWRDTVGKVR